MKTKVADVRPLDILGNGDRSSAQKVFNAVLKQWWQKLSYCSIFATVPAMLGSQVAGAQVAGAQADEPKKTKVNIPGRPTSLLDKQNRNRSNIALLKRQNKFLLPHQKGSFAMLAALAGNDDCPGRPIPGGTYTAAAPYIDSGDTTGANNTVTSLLGYYYYYDALGPDHVYSFTLTGLGQNPQIEVSTTSGTYKPLAYVLRGDWGPCPAGAGNSVGHVWHTHDSRWFPGTSTATLDISGYPLNVPFLLFVDSRFNDALGSGPYTIKMKNVTVDPAAACPNPNPIDCAGFFITQQFQDFLGREPDATGFQNWVNTLAVCPNGGYGEFDNPGCDRVHVSAGFFQSNEFLGRGYWILRFGFVGLNRSIGTVRSSATYAEFVPALQQIGGSNSPAQEEAAKVAYTNAFVQRSDFQALFPAGLSNSQYVNGLESNAGVTLNNKQALIDGLNNMTMTRAGVLRNVVESQIVFDKFIIPSFVTMEYFGYLRRDVDEIGYRNWVDTLTADPNNYRHMIFGFIYSTEYRARFGQP